MFITDYITENEVLLAAKYMKNGKAPGYDMVVNEYIKSTINLFLPLNTKENKSGETIK
jgi:hypothetical protein